MAKGRLKVRRKEDGSLSRFIMLPGQRKLAIPLTFMIDMDMDGQDCDYEINDKGGIIKITVGGKEVPINTDLLKTRETQQQQRQEAEALRRQQEQEARRKEQNQSRSNSGQAQQPVKAYSPATLSHLPKDARQLLGNHEIDNLALRLFKAANFWGENKNKATLSQAKRGSPKKGIPDQIMRHLPDGKMNYGHFPFADHAKNQLLTTQSLYADKTIHHQYQTQSRLVTGIGGASVYEVGFTLHHIYGFPYIPASSIKGCTRSWYIQNEFNGVESEALKNRAFCDLFGCPAELIERKDAHQIKHPSWYALNPQFLGDKGERKGKIIFFDAYPTHAPQVEEDVMNVHYPKYYQGDELPTDYQMPVPIAFLAVAPKTTFQFVMATANRNDEANQLMHKAQVYLHGVLTEHGIGAKTAVGYGYFSPLNPQ
ncbi:type III-B CRISPR module RAMP protein Cmr6 [Haliscomenobacter hydrossis]|uniref:CRISPR-associated RAMP protein, Cmr6 family n=1 Tax=Haliscomenobacter hydrossis (strain ATCC 27775 / DSM 1100 / LMG 10767 / O) TaxID=760192 RepID=F4L2K2_HALH1|nr:type III-B CRISPR module RAMP protein Cmr6 [Haliscomenobacter hydrossis]AEE53920.1 CRISPR-associated RAMP protein, Cmr6 family [Haliscomenobacter hydrossis DSM 1100]